MGRWLLRAMRRLAYLGMLGVLFAFVAYLAFSLFVRRGVTSAPELFGLGEEEARALLADQGLRAELSDERARYDERVPLGHVLMQRPHAGTLIKRGSTITLTLSRGQQLIEVPSVLGAAPQAARVTLVAAGLALGRTLGVFTGEGKSGVVLAQRPAQGVLVERDAPVDLFVAHERSGETYIMPDLVNLSYERTRRYFEAHGFRVGRVSYESYAGVVPGTILRQFPLAGHPLRPGDVISLDVVAPQPHDEAPAAAGVGNEESP